MQSSYEKVYLIRNYADDFKESISISQLSLAVGGLVYRERTVGPNMGFSLNKREVLGNVIKKTKLDGSKVNIRLKMSEPANINAIFSTERQSLKAPRFGENSYLDKWPNGDIYLTKAFKKLEEARAWILPTDVEGEDVTSSWFLIERGLGDVRKY